MRNYILDPSDFTFEPFHDEREHPGESGHLLLATHKANGMKLVVKHEVPSDIPNEFVAGFVAEHLGFYNPKVYLFKQGKEFKNAVGIEFMEGLQTFDFTNLSPEQQTDLIHQVSLCFLCYQDDRLQMNLWNNHVVSYDYAWSFSMDATTFPNSLASFHTHLNNYSNHLLFAPDIAAKVMKMNYEEAREEIDRIYYEGLKPIITLDRDGLFDILFDFYPNDISGYYDACVGIMIEKTTKELSKKGYL